MPQLQQQLLLSLLLLLLLLLLQWPTRLLLAFCEVSCGRRRRVRTTT